MTLRKSTGLSVLVVATVVLWLSSVWQNRPVSQVRPSQAVQAHDPDVDVSAVGQVAMPHVSDTASLDDHSLSDQSAMTNGLIGEAQTPAMQGRFKRDITESNFIEYLRNPESFWSDTEISRNQQAIKRFRDSLPARQIVPTGADPALGLPRAHDRTLDVFARSKTEAAWMDSHGFPRDLSVLSWDRSLVEAAANAFDPMAQNMMMLMKFEQGDTQWEKSALFAVNRTAFNARFRYAVALGKVMPGDWARVRAGTASKRPPPTQDYGTALIWDVVARRLGDDAPLTATIVGETMIKVEDVSAALGRAESMLANAAALATASRPFVAHPSARRKAAAVP